MLCGTWHEMRRNHRHSWKFRGGFGEILRLAAIHVLAHKRHDDDSPRLRFHTAGLSGPLLARQVLHSGGARLGGNVGASVGEGPAPGAGKEDAVFVAAKHSHVMDPA